MAYYQTLKDTKKEKKRYTYGKEEGNRYNRKGNRESNRISVNDRPSSANGYPGERDMRPEYEKTRDERKPERKSRGTWREEERRMKSPSPAERPSHRDVTTGYRNYEYRTAEERNDTVSREEQAQYILTGRNPIREALKNHRDLEKLLVQKGELSGSAMEIVQKAKEQKVMIQVVDKTRLDEIAPRHQGLIAFASAYRYVTVEEILETAKEKGEPPFIVILDGVTDPHNLGAII